jgi:hypothetical protein
MYLGRERRYTSWDADIWIVRSRPADYVEVWLYRDEKPVQLTKDSCKLVYTSFGDVDQFSAHAVACYEQTLLQAQRNGTKIKALVIANPHNPLGQSEEPRRWRSVQLTTPGQCYTSSALVAILNLCQKYSIHLISDEIYASSVYHTDASHPGFTSVLAVASEYIVDAHFVHVVYGMSKVRSLRRRI